MKYPLAALRKTVVKKKRRVRGVIMFAEGEATGTPVFHKMISLLLYRAREWREDERRMQARVRQGHQVRRVFGNRIYQRGKIHVISLKGNGRERWDSPCVSLAYKRTCLYTLDPMPRSCRRGDPCVLLRSLHLTHHLATCIFICFSLHAQHRSR